MFRQPVYSTSASLAMQPIWPAVAKLCVQAVFLIQSITVHLFERVVLSKRCLCKPTVQLLNREEVLCSGMKLKAQATSSERVMP